jgi:ubiquinone/menaquinone biosynthesis C-methylase UbiE
MSNRYSPEEIKRANIVYHTRMADAYDRDQPCFSPENIQRMEEVIRNLAKRYGDGSLLDVGCGTGFIINIARRYFNRVTGVDITRAMLDKVDLSSGNIELKVADAADMPFPNESFDVCTAYGFLHHLLKLTPTFKEVYRCLKKGGVLYADQEPNYYCRREIDKLGGKKYSEVLQGEVDHIRGIYHELKEKYGLDEETARLAEFQNLARRGMKEETILNALKKTGFSEVDFQYQWFLGQGYILHNVSEKAARDVEEHLRKLLPLSRNLFKYFSFTAVK